MFLLIPAQTRWKVWWHCREMHCVKLWVLATLLALYYREGGHPGYVLLVISVLCQFCLIGLGVLATIGICQDPASDIPFYHHYHGGECCSQLPWEIPSLYHLCYVITNFLEDLLSWGHVSCLNPDLLNTFQPILHINTILWKHWGSGQDCSLPWWSGERECDCQHPSSAYRHFLLSCVCFFFQGC